MDIRTAAALIATALDAGQIDHDTAIPSQAAIRGRHYGEHSTGRNRQLKWRRAHKGRTGSENRYAESRYDARIGEVIIATRGGAHCVACGEV